MKRFVPQKMQEDEWEAFQAFETNQKVTKWLEEKNRTVSLDIDGEIVSIMGVIPLPQGGGHVWLFFSNKVGTDELVMCTHWLQGMFNALKDIGYEWLQTPIKEGFRQGRKWGRILGFEETEQKEDIMENGIMYTYWTRVL
mgnify:CR=1 FL=1|tara:strand:+ start:415 stop:834 length:420 start_codon:yes stop_codon:yes gene_type:complete